MIFTKIWVMLFIVNCDALVFSIEKTDNGTFHDQTLIRLTSILKNNISNWGDKNKFV